MMVVEADLQVRLLLFRPSHPRKPFETELACDRGVGIPLVTRVLPVLLDTAASERQPHLPGTRIDGGVFDRHFVVDRVRRDDRETLDHAPAVAEQTDTLI